jgi:hypothetical protein
LSAAVRMQTCSSRQGTTRYRVQQVQVHRIESKEGDASAGQMSMIPAKVFTITCVAMLLETKSASRDIPSAMRQTKSSPPICCGARTVSRIPVGQGDGLDVCRVVGNL